MNKNEKLTYSYPIIPVFIASGNARFGPTLPLSPRAPNLRTNARGFVLRYFENAASRAWVWGWLCAPPAKT